MSYLNILEAAGRVGLSPTHLRELCRAGQVDGAVKVGGTWIVPDPPVVHRRRLGRPPAK